MGSHLQPVKRRPAGPTPRRRTFAQWILILGFLALSISGWARMVYSLQNAYWLNFAGVVPGPVYLAISGGMWGLAGLAALVWVYPRRSGYRLVGSAAALFFALTYWADRIFFTRTGGTGPNVLFAILMTLALLGYTALVLRPFADLKITAPGLKKGESNVEVRTRD